MISQLPDDSSNARNWEEANKHNIKAFCFSQISGSIVTNCVGHTPKAEPKDQKMLKTPTLVFQKVKKKHQKLTFHVVFFGWVLQKETLK